MTNRPPETLSALKDQLEHVNVRLLNLIREGVHDREALLSRLDELEKLQAESKKIRVTIRYNRRILVFGLIWIAFIVCLGAVVVIDLSDGKLDSLKAESGLVESVAGALAGLSTWVASGKADQYLN